MQAVLFDLDGTLLDTLEDIADSLNAVLGREGLPAHSLADYRKFIGDGLDLLIRRSFPSGLFDEEQIAAFLNSVREEYGRRWTDKTAPYEGIPDMLNTLAERGIATAVLSNKPHDMTVRCVEKFLRFHRFAAVRGARPGVPRKPDPEAALEIAGEMGLEPGRFLYVGDTPTDMQTGINSGMHPVGVLWGFRTGTELKIAGAKQLVSAPAEILAYF